MTFHLIVFTLVFFSAASLASALAYFRSMIPGIRSPAVPAGRFDLTLLGLSAHTFILLCAAAACMEAVHWLSRQPRWVARFVQAPRFVRWGIYYASALLLFWTARTTTTFIYAQF